MKNFIKTTIPNYQKKRLFYSLPHLSLLLEIDHFNWNKHRNLSDKSFKIRQSGDLIIWNDKFKDGLNLEVIERQKDIEVLKIFKTPMSTLGNDEKMVLVQVK